MSQIVQQFGENRSVVALASALKWSVLSTEPKSKFATNKVVRNKAALVNGSRFCVLSIGLTSYLGTYTQAVSALSTPKSTHSLALIFVGALVSAGADINAINAILLLQPQNGAEKRVLIIVEGGEIVRDVVENTTTAIQNALAARDLLPSHKIYAQYSEISGAEIVTWNLFYEARSSATLLMSTPRNPLALLGALLVVVACMSVALIHWLIIEPENKRQRLAAVAALDKTPEYVFELRKSLASLAWSRADLSNAMIALQKHVFYSSGWVLESRECSSSLQSCVLLFKRSGGQLSSLLALFPKAVYDVAGSSLESARLNEPQVIERAKLELDDLPSSENAAKQIRETLQQFTNADLSITSGPSERWPIVDFSKVKASSVATKGALQITVPLPKVENIISLLPPFVQIDSYVLLVTTDDPSSFFKVLLKGSVYAR